MQIYLLQQKETISTLIFDVIFRDPKLYYNNSNSNNNNDNE